MVTSKMVILPNPRWPTSFDLEAVDLGISSEVHVLEFVVAKAVWKVDHVTVTKIDVKEFVVEGYDNLQKEEGIICMSVSIPGSKSRILATNVIKEGATHNTGRLLHNVISYLFQNCFLTSLQKTKLKSLLAPTDL